MTAVLLTGIIATMIGAILIGVHGGSFTTLGYQSRVQAHYAAEAGLATALEKLRDRGWDTGFANQQLAGGKGRFSLTFSSDPTGTVAADESVNNLLGLTTVNGPRGTGTVAPGTAHLVIRGQSGLQSETLEAVIRNGAFPVLGQAILADDSVEFNDNVRVSGIDTLAEGNPLPSGVHSNSTSTNGDLIGWYGTGSAVFDGTISVAGPAAGINMSGASLNGSPPTEGGSRAVTFPHINIANEVTSKSGAPTVAIPPTGDLTVGTGTPQDFHVAGNTTVHGDLVLDGGTLYVDGDLVVHGTVSGDGGVYVNGKTTFYGDAAVSTNNQQKVAVYSSDDLTLRGFNGTSYIEGKTSDATLQTLWARTQAAVTDLKVNLAANNLDQVDQIRASLGEAHFPVSQPPLYQPPGTGGWSTHGHDLFRGLADHLENNYPADPQRDFLIERFKEQEYFFHNYDIDVDRALYPLSSHGWPNEVTMDDWRNRTGHPGGPFDQMLDKANPSNLRYQPGPAAVANFKELSTVVEQIDASQLGTAFFQGLVYTGGELHVEHELHVLGGVLAQKGLGDGKMIIQNGTHITFVEEYFDPSVTSTAGGPPQIVSRVVR